MIPACLGETSVIPGGSLSLHFQLLNCYHDGGGGGGDDDDEVSVTFTVFTVFTSIAVPILSCYYFNLSLTQNTTTQRTMYKSAKALSAPTRFFPLSTITSTVTVLIQLTLFNISLEDRPISIRSSLHLLEPKSTHSHSHVCSSVCNVIWRCVIFRFSGCQMCTFLKTTQVQQISPRCALFLFVLFVL